jgi:hypothetical protein
MFPIANATRGQAHQAKGGPIARLGSPRQASGSRIRTPSIGGPRSPCYKDTSPFSVQVRAWIWSGVVKRRTSECPRVE